jgi:hypothetical protein
LAEKNCILHRVREEEEISGWDYTKGLPKRNPDTSRRRLEASPDPAPMTSNKGNVSMI